jgi:hypothetical protein
MPLFIAWAWPRSGSETKRTFGSSIDFRNSTVPSVEAASTIRCSCGLFSFATLATVSGR